jgi:hypothetical protein
VVDQRNVAFGEGTRAHGCARLQEGEAAKGERGLAVRNVQENGGIARATSDCVLNASEWSGESPAAVCWRPIDRAIG